MRAALAETLGLGDPGRSWHADRTLILRIADWLTRMALALGKLGLFVSAMVDPAWFAARMQGVALVPEPLWWLLGVVVSFYFGARHQQKSQEFQRSLAATFARAPQVIAAARAAPETNAALDEWRKGGG